MTNRRLALVARRVEGLSGATRLIIEEARAAVAAGWDVHVFGERLDHAAIRLAGARPRQVPSWPWGPWLKRRAFAAFAGRMVRGFDVVHGHGDLFDQDLLSLHNCVHAAHEATHGSPLPADAPVGRIHAHQLAQRRFRLLAANSRLMKDDVVTRFGVPEGMIEVVYPGFEPSRFDPRDRERLGRPLRASLGLADTWPHASQRADDGGIPAASFGGSVNTRPGFIPGPRTVCVSPIVVLSLRHGLRTCTRTAALCRAVGSRAVSTTRAKWSGKP